ncbi:hypothetical protein SVIOM74S_02295 [Streptomyces violarus]
MIISPWVVGESPDAGVVWNNIIIGALAVILGLGVRRHGGEGLLEVLDPAETMPKAGPRPDLPLHVRSGVSLPAEAQALQRGPEEKGRR